MRMIQKKRKRWVEHVALMRAWIETLRILMRKSEEKAPLRMSRCRCEDNIKLEIRNMEYGNIG
jgi:hypothetical protein